MGVNVFVKGGGGDAALEAVTATANDVLEGKTFNDSDGEVQTGTIPNKGELIETVGVDGSYKVNEGGYYSVIQITGPTLTGDAIASHVLENETFYSNNGTKQTGTMRNRGNVTIVPEVGQEITNDGYFSMLKVNGPTLTGDATTADVKAGKTFYSNSGNKLTGTLPTKTVTSTINNLNLSTDNIGSVTGSAGYYNNFTIKAQYAIQRVYFWMSGTGWHNSHILASGLWGASVGEPTATSFKAYASNDGYIWVTKNAGKDCNIYITRAYQY